MTIQTDPKLGIKRGWLLGAGNHVDGLGPDIRNSLDKNFFLTVMTGNVFVVKSKGVGTAPGSPADGDCYIQSAAWSGVGAANNVAGWDAANSVWRAVAPTEGFLAYVQDENKWYQYDGSMWSVTDKFKGTYASSAALISANPTGAAGDWAIVDTGSGAPPRAWYWDANATTPAWVAGSDVAPATTDAVPEGSTNLYFTAARVRAAVLTGLSIAVNAAVVATDTALEAFGKLQAQINNRLRFDASQTLTVTEQQNALVNLGMAFGGLGFFRSIFDALNQRAYLQGIKVCLFGNSIVIGYNGGRMFEWFVYQSGSKLSLLKNAGISGNSSAAMLARINTDVPADSVIVPFMEGTNDAAGGATVATHRSNYSAIIENLISRGMVPVMIATPPYDLATGKVEVYRAVQFYLAQKYGITYWDPWVDYTDPANGKWVAGAASDDAHPTYATQQGGAAKLVAFINQTATPPGFGPRSNTPNVAAPSGFLLSGGNCLMLTDTNANGVADGWVQSGTATASLVAATGGFRGNFQRLTTTGGAGSPYLRKTITTGWAANDELMLSLVIGTNAAVTNGEVSISITYDSTGHEVFRTAEDLAPRRIMIPFKPTSTSNILVTIRIDSNSVSSGEYYDFGEFELYNVTALATL